MTIIDQRNDLIKRSGDNFEVVMENYFEEFKIEMKNMMRIAKSVVDRYYDEICFIMETNFEYAHVLY